MEETLPADAGIAPILAGPVLFDTMLIRHLCVAGGGDILAAGFGGRFHWGPAVQNELTLQSQYLPALRKFMATRPGTVLELTPEEDREVEDIRLDMYTKKAARLSDTEHLGEAQCLFLAQRDGLPLATNDGKAREFARAAWDDANNRPRVPGTHRVELFHVCEVLYALIRLGSCKPARAWELYCKACEAGLYDWPGYPIPGSHDRFVGHGGALRAQLLRERALASAAT